MQGKYYVDFIKTVAPQVITQIDRDEDSMTFGCCDRNFWHLKIRDFSSAILQQSGLVLTLLYSLDFYGNIYYKNENVKKWALGTLDYWCKIQLKDGSFNEYYPNEHGFPPTAFSLYSACEIYKRLGVNDENIKLHLIKTARFLSKNIERQASNQEIASITALYSLYEIEKEEWIFNAIETKLSRILKTQSNEGWFPEYGGADFGYLSVSLDMLAEYYYMSNDERVKGPLNKIVEFIKHFVHPDGTIGGEYGSRNTIYFLPNGLEVLINEGNKDALYIKKKIYSGDKYNFMNAVDDRYLSHYVMHSYLRAVEKENVEMNKQQIQDTLYKRFFNEAGLFVSKKEDLFLVCSLKKGGILKVFDKEKEYFVDFGYRVKTPKYTASTNWLDHKYTIEYDDINNILKVSGKFNAIKQQLSSPLKHLALRILSFTLGKSIISLLKRKLIFIDNNIDVKFKREIIISEDLIQINDNIESKNKIDLKEANSFSLRHVASGKFFKTSDLLVPSKIDLKNVQNISIAKTVSLKTQESVINISNSNG